MTLHRVFVFIKTRRVFFEAALIGIIALSLRLVNLENWPRWYVDEGVYGAAGVNLLRGMWGDTAWGPNFSAPLFAPLLTSGMVSLMGNTYFAVRLPGAIFGSISCVLLYFIGTKLYNRFTGISASLLLLVASTTMNRMALTDNLVEFFFITAVFFYLKLREEGQHRWTYFIGIAVGLVFLSKYVGIAVLIFIIFQSLIDRGSFGIWKAILIFVVIALISPLIGVIVNWGLFLQDTIEPGARLAYLDHVLYTVMMSSYRSQLEWWRFQYDIWATTGFILLFYLLARNDDGDRLCCLWAASILLVYFFYGSGWWIFLLILYPVYSLAISVALHDIVYERGNFHFLAVFVLLLLLPVFTYRYLYPDALADYGKYAFYAVALFAFLLLLVKRISAGLTYSISAGVSKIIQRTGKTAFQVIMLLPIISVILAGAIFQVKPVFTVDDSADQRNIINWLNTNTHDGELVAASAAIIYPLQKATGISYESVMHVTTRQSFLNFTETMFSRYNLDSSLWKMNYFVVDTPLRSIGPGQFFAETVEATWKQVHTAGDYEVYRNPGYAAPPIWLSGGTGKGAAPASEVSIEDGQGSLTLASTTAGKVVSQWMRSVLAYALPLDITVVHSIPELNTPNFHTYNLALIGKVDQFIIIHYTDNPGILEVGVQNGEKWVSLWQHPQRIPSGSVQWRVTMDENSFVFYENGVRLSQIPNTLPQKEFIVSLSHDTSDTTLKTWKIYSMAAVQRKQP